MTDELRDCYDDCQRDLIQWDWDACYQTCDDEFKQQEDES